MQRACSLKCSAEKLLHQSSMFPSLSKFLPAGKPRGKSKVVSKILKPPFFQCSTWDAGAALPSSVLLGLRCSEIFWAQFILIVTREWNCGLCYSLISCSLSSPDSRYSTKAWFSCNKTFPQLWGVWGAGSACPRDRTEVYRELKAGIAVLEFVFLALWLEQGFSLL